MALGGSTTAVAAGPDAKSAAPAAPAESREDVLRRARKHFEDGKKAFEARDYAGALKEFSAGYALEPRPGFLLNMAHSTQKVGDLAGARELYTRFLQTNPTGEERRVAEDAIAEIDGKLASAPPAVPPPDTGTTAATAPGATGQPVTPLGAPSSATPASSGKSSGPTALPDLGAQQSGTPLVTAPGSSSDSGSESKPLYARWWFWTGLVVVAGGVAAAVVLGSKSSSGHDSGSWGQLQL